VTGVAPASASDEFAAGVAGAGAALVAGVVTVPVFAAELVEEAALAGSEAFAGPSSDTADLHAMTARIIAATHALLRHAKRFELNRTFIESMPPRRLSKFAPVRMHPEYQHHCELVPGDLRDFNLDIMVMGSVRFL
jgi:hypothetical protein